MIQTLPDLPQNMVGFKATGEVTEKDFTETVLPAVKELVDRTGKLNYLLDLETSIKNFTIGAWLQDAILGIKHLSKWNKAAIVTDDEDIRKYTGLFSKVMPGEYKGFAHKEMLQAIEWVSEETI